jgi:hypothetical protein
VLKSLGAPKENKKMTHDTFIITQCDKQAASCNAQVQTHSEFVAAAQSPNGRCKRVVDSYEELD